MYQPKPTETMARADIPVTLRISLLRSLRVVGGLGLLVVALFPWLVIEDFGSRVRVRTYSMALRNWTIRSMYRMTRIGSTMSGASWKRG